MNYVAHVTAQNGIVHRIDVAGSDRTTAARDALRKVTGAVKVSIRPGYTPPPKPFYIGGLAIPT